jgi:hypothetical protein
MVRKAIGQEIQQRHACPVFRHLEMDSPFHVLPLKP